jgi:hypothetical protein
MRITRLALIACLAICLAGIASAQTQTTVGAYTLRFVSVQYDWAAPSSTWTYGLTWNGTPPALSHLTIDLCDTAVVLGYDPTDLPVDSTDGSVAGFAGKVIKWDNMPDGYLTPGVEKFFSFTLDNTYAVTSGVMFWAKAGTLANQGVIDGPSCEIANPDIDVEKSCTDDVFVGDMINYTITVENTGNVTLTNVVVSDPLAGIDEVIASFAPGATATFPASVAATEAGSVENTVTAAGSYYGNVVDDTDSCTTTVWELSVSKTAVSYYTREWDWTLDKSVDQDSIEICDDTPVTIQYTIDVTRTNTDSDHNVSGTITVNNPAPINASVTVTDDYAGISATVNCPSATVAAESSLVCTYSIDLASAIEGDNVATATLGNGTSFDSDPVAVTFGAPDVDTDASVTIDDVLTCPEGFICSELANQWQVGDDASITWDVAIQKNGADCNSYFDLVNTVTLVETDASLSDSVTTEIYTCECPFGCTLTIGYWKTHAGFHGRNADVVTQYLPIWLGTPGADSKAVEVATATEAVHVLSFGLGQPSNGITKLYAQLLAAKLNIANGSSSTEILGELGQADSFLAKYDWEDWNSLKQGDKKKVLGWVATFDGYNNGDIGPGHCD